MGLGAALNDILIERFWNIIQVGGLGRGVFVRHWKAPRPEKPGGGEQQGKPLPCGCAPLTPHC